MTFDVYPNDGDTITENRETRSRARSNSSEYVERGLGITLNGDGTFDVGAGFAIVRDGTDAWEVEDETGTTGVSLADTTTTNFIYLTFDPTASDVEGSAGYHVDTDQTPPTTPSLFIATADESAGTVTEKNREPVVSAESVDGPVTSTAITNFEGSALSVDGSGNLNASGLAATVIDSGSTTAYTTQGEDVIYVDTSTAAVTITLASGDATQGNEIRVVNIDATNPVTVDTEGTETIDPGAEASKSIGKAGWSVAFVSGGSNWDSSLSGEFERLSAGGADVTGETYIRATLGTSKTSIAAGTWTNPVDTEDADNLAEFNEGGSARINLDAAGVYWVSANARLSMGADGDLGEMRLRNVTDATTISPIRLDGTQTGGAGQETLQFTLPLELPAGKDLELQARDNDSTFEIKSSGTILTVTKSLVHQ